MERTVLRADEGMLLTNGQVTGHTIFLAEGEDSSAYRQIPEQDFFEAVEDPASSEDYQAALFDRYGVNTD
jgi:hypothetical protein